MSTSVIPIRLVARRLTEGACAVLLAGACGGDDLFLPVDGTPTQLRAVSGNGQRAPAGSPVDDPLIVEALDAAGRPVPSAPIVFQFLAAPEGAEIVPASTATGADGTASAEVTLGTAAVTHTVEARLDDPESNLTARFQLTALGPPGDGGDGGGGGGDGDGDGDGDEGGGGGGGNGNGNGNGNGHGNGNGGGPGPGGDDDD